MLVLNNITKLRLREIDFVLQGHCQNLLDDPRRRSKSVCSSTIENLKRCISPMKTSQYTVMPQLKKNEILT